MTSILGVGLNLYQLHKVARRKARQNSELKTKRSGIIHALDRLIPLDGDCSEEIISVAVTNPHHRFIKELPIPQSRPVVNRHVELIINMDSRHDSIVRFPVIKGCDYQRALTLWLGVTEHRLKPHNDQHIKHSDSNQDFFNHIVLLFVYASPTLRTLLTTDLHQKRCTPRPLALNARLLSLATHTNALVHYLVSQTHELTLLVSRSLCPKSISQLGDFSMPPQSPNTGLFSP